MNKRTGLLALAVTAGLSTFSVAPAFATGHWAGPVGQVCDEGTSGKQDVTGAGHTEVTIVAPQGQLIESYCVKAGSAKHGNGPETVVLPTPQAEVTFSHSSGKDISHYSYTLVPAPVVVTPVPETPEVPEVPETPTPEVPEVPTHETPELPETPEEPTPEVPEVPTHETPEVPETPEEPTPEVPVEETPVEEEVPVVVVPVEVEVPVTVEVPLTPVVGVDTPDNVLPVLDYSAAGVYYENCAEVRDVLGRSILMGEAGFRAGLDRDSDGIGCELDTDGNWIDQGTENNSGNSGVLVTDEGTGSTEQLAYTGTDDSTKIAGGIGAGLLALGAGLVLAGRGRHRAVKA